MIVRFIIQQSNMEILQDEKKPQLQQAINRWITSFLYSADEVFSADDLNSSALYESLLTV